MFLIRILLSVALLVLSGCATVLPPVQSESVPFALNGRIKVVHDGTSDSAGLRWIHLAQSDEILLLTPLGQTVARIYRDNTHATLDEGDKHYSDTDIEPLMMQVLGWRLQLDALHHWVLGMKTADDTIIDYDKLGRITVLRQDGWEVQYMSFADETAHSLPRRMLLTRPDLQLTLLIDEWDGKVPGDK
jgi:outer membrane lipoprotein LolB